LLIHYHGPKALLTEERIGYELTLTEIPACKTMINNFTGEEHILSSFLFSTAYLLGERGRGEEKDERTFGGKNFGLLLLLLLLYIYICIFTALRFSFCHYSDKLEHKIETTTHPLPNFL
jgi:hypothetical protein